MYNRAVEVQDAAYVDVRVCDLQIQYGNMPSGLDSSFHIDGLYVVLRCGDEVRRTNCLWPSSTPVVKGKGQLVDTLAREEDENDWIWNELFRFVLPPASEAENNDATVTPSPQTSQGLGAAAGVPPASASASTSFTPPLTSKSSMVMHRRDDPSNAVLPTSTAATNTAATEAVTGSQRSSNIPAAAASFAYASQDSTRTSPGPRGGNFPFLRPAVELELWRSTPAAENCLGRYTYHVPLELLHGGYGLQRLDTVAERVVPLRTKEAPSIMGNLYGWSGHRLSLRLRVQAVGLPPVTADWTLPADTQTSLAMTTTTGAAMSGGYNSGNNSGSYLLPYSLGMTEAAGRSAVLQSDYGTTMGTLNPVLANLLAPLGVSTVGGQGQLGRPVAGVMGSTPVNHTASSGLPPVFNTFGASSTGAVLSGLEGSSAGGSASGGQGILGEGDVAWRGAVLPAVFPQYSGTPGAGQAATPPKQQHQK